MALRGVKGWIKLTMNHSFALEEAEPNAPTAQPTLAWTYTTHSSVDIALYSVEVEEQLAALKQAVAALRQRETVTQSPGGVSPPLAAPAEAACAAVEHRLAALEQTLVNRKVHEHQLRFSASLQENVSDAVITTDLTFRIQSWNRAAETIYGWRAADVLGQPVQEILQTQFASDAVREQIRQVLLQQGGWQGEIVQYRRDGVPLHILGSVTLLRDAYGAAVGIVAVNHDITERKRAEESLRQSEAKFRQFVDAAPVSIIVTDQYGQITLLNRQAELLFDYQRHELLGQPLEVLVPEVMRHQHEAHRLAYLAAPRMREMGSGLELFARRRDGVAIPVEIQLSYIETASGLLVMSFVIDITERKRAATALRKQRDFLQLVIDSVPTLIMVKDQANRFQLVNQGFAQRYRATPADLLGKADTDRLERQTEPHLLSQREQAVLETGQPLFSPVEKLFDRYYQSNLIPLQNEGGAFDRLLVVASDITTHQQAEVALQRMLQKERELNDLKSRVVTTASHELRTPLASILALTETLYAYRHKLTDAQIDQRLNGVREQVGFLRTIISNMTQVEQLQSGYSDLQRTPVDLDVLCRSVLDEFRAQPGFRHYLNYGYLEGGPVLALDKRLMRQVIRNLVENALKYSAPGTVVHLALTYTAAKLCIDVQDEGIGIPAADLAHLFQPFQRAANVGATSGAGLGLVIAKEAVELHGGTITVISEVGKGTTFTVSIPCLGEGIASDEKNLAQPHEPTNLVSYQ